MPSTQISSEDCSQHHRLIHWHAVKTSAVAAGSALIPLPLGAAIDLAGFDPVRYCQQRMLRELCGTLDLDPMWVGMRLNIAFMPLATRRQAATVARKLVAQGIERAARQGATRLLGRGAVRMLPVAGAVVASGLAFHETRRLGLRCLQLRGIKHKGKRYV